MSTIDTWSVAHHATLLAREIEETKPQYDTLVAQHRAAKLELRRLRSRYRREKAELLALEQRDRCADVIARKRRLVEQLRIEKRVLGRSFWELQRDLIEVMERLVSLLGRTREDRLRARTVAARREGRRRV